jgi:hypothetical protein
MAKQKDDHEKTDEELFIPNPNEAFWTAKRLTPRRAARLHYWIAGALEGVLQEFEADQAVTLTALVSRLVGVLGEESFLEILSIICGRPKEELADVEFDYQELGELVTEFVEINRLEEAFRSFFGRFGQLSAVQELWERLRSRIETGLDDEKGQT